MRRTMVLRSELSQRFDIEVKGVEVIETRYRKGTPRPYVKAHPTEALASAAFRKRVSTKLGEGFVHVTPPAEVPPGGLRFEARSPGGGGGGVLDLSADGRRLVTAGVGPRAHGYSVSVLDVDTGAERVVLEQAPGPHQTFVHSALFDASGERLLVQVNTQVMRVDLSTGTSRVVSSWGEGRDSRFNPFVVQPVMSASRTRCALPGPGDMVHVIDVDSGELLRACSTRAETTECRGLALSAAGDALALYVPSRGLVYGHEDARHDASNRIELVDVVTGAQRTVVEPERQVSHLGFGPREDELWTIWSSAQGPVGYSLSDGIERWRFRDARRDDRLAIAFSAACTSTAGAPLFAVGREGLKVYDARAVGPPAGPLGLERLPHARVSRVVFSGDGAWLAGWGNGVAFVQRTPALQNETP